MHTGAGVALSVFIFIFLTRSIVKTISEESCSRLVTVRMKIKYRTIWLKVLKIHRIHDLIYLSVLLCRFLISGVDRVKMPLGFY